MVAKISDLLAAEEMIEDLEDLKKVIPQLILMLKLGICCKRAHAENNGSILLRVSGDL